MRYWIDAFRVHRMDVDEVAARVTLDNKETVDRTLDDGGAILATQHLGSWDVGALWSIDGGWPMWVVAEVVEPRALFDRFVRLRQEAGAGVIPLLKGGDMIDRLRGDRRRRGPGHPARRPRPHRARAGRVVLR